MTLILSVCSYHVTYAFQSESTLYSCLNVKELLARNLKLRDCNWTRTHNHLFHKRTLNHLAKLDKWLNCFNYLSVRCIWLYELIISRTRFKVNPHSVVAWMSGNYLLEAGAKSEFQISEVETDNVGSTLFNVVNANVDLNVSTLFDVARSYQPTSNV